MSDVYDDTDTQKQKQTNLDSTFKSIINERRTPKSSTHTHTQHDLHCIVNGIHTRYKWSTDERTNEREKKEETKTKKQNKIIRYDDDYYKYNNICTQYYVDSYYYKLLLYEYASSSSSSSQSLFSDRVECGCGTMLFIYDYVCVCVMYVLPISKHYESWFSI